ncbi:MAG: ABC transporter ATP-binding protein [Azoarcus sp. PHD]|nr:MAG: ABC transporter ATP-binding protein [Azoarcus sp. PHD]
MIAIERISHRYRSASTAALDAITLDVGRGSLFGLLGPNGAGKTTLISLIAGLIAPQQGQIRVSAQTLSDFRRARPNAIALVPQDYAFYPMLTVAENLAFFAGVQGLDRHQQKARSSEAIRFARLESVARQLAGELSGGLRRRLNLAIGLLGDPALLLLDEPTVGVDPQSRHFLLDAIRDLRDAGKTVIYTSHYMDEVEAICDRIAIIDHGRVLASGTLAEVLGAGEPQLLLRLDRDLPQPLLKRWEAAHTVTTQGANSICLTPVPAAALPQILQDLAAHGLTPLALNHGQQNLEQVFMHLTRRSLRD